MRSLTFKSNYVIKLWRGKPPCNLEKKKEKVDAIITERTFVSLSYKRGNWRGGREEEKGGGERKKKRSKGMVRSA